MLPGTEGSGQQPWRRLADRPKSFRWKHDLPTNTWTSKELVGPLSSSNSSFIFCLIRDDRPITGDALLLGNPPECCHASSPCSFTPNSTLRVRRWKEQGGSTKISSGRAWLGYAIPIFSSSYLPTFTCTKGLWGRPSHPVRPSTGSSRQSLSTALAHFHPTQQLQHFGKPQEIQNSAKTGQGYHPSMRLNLTCRTTWLYFCTEDQQQPPLVGAAILVHCKQTVQHGYFLADILFLRVFLSQA